MTSAVLAAIPVDVPVDPDAPTAQDWLITELSKAVYQAAKPTLFDRIAKAISDWLDSLQFGTVQGPPALGLGVVVVLVVAAIVIAFLIFGVPRLNRRSSFSGSLFGDDDTRTAARMREDAAAAASRGDYSAAVAEMFRAIARGLFERTIVTATPGTTARDFAVQAGAAFPPLADRLAQAARSFDEVRYLGRAGSELQFDLVATLEADLRAARPVLETISA